MQKESYIIQLLRQHHDEEQQTQFKDGNEVLRLPTQSNRNHSQKKKDELEAIHIEEGKENESPAVFANTMSTRELWEEMENGLKQWANMIDGVTKLDETASSQLYEKLIAISTKRDKLQEEADLSKSVNDAIESIRKGRRITQYRWNQQ